MADTFDDDYVKQLAKIVDVNGKPFTYRTDEFANPHNPLWPQQSFDYPYGQAPEVDDLPPEERADWEEHVRTHYLKAAFATGGAGSDPLANQASTFMALAIGANKARVYPDLDDNTFLSMVTEGVFSQFLCALDHPADPTNPDRFDDYARFGLTPDDPKTSPYLKCDLSCMQVVKNTWSGEHVYPTVVVVQRQKYPNGSEWMTNYTLIGIEIWDASTALTPDDEKKARLAPATSRVLKFADVPTMGADDKEIWRRAKYFVLQGCLHRLNLIDHVRVHFPHDTINAITKSVLPKWHFMYQLLVPHFWLTLPVNHAMLEGDRSLINRDTWYPWSPFAAKGDEIRKLLPYAWSGNEYYYPGTQNTAYPPYSFCLDPFAVFAAGPDAGRMLPPPSGLAPASNCPSWYRSLQAYLYDYVLTFVKAIIAATLPPPPTSTDQADILWLEIKRWAHEISRFLPGFPDENAICTVPTDGPDKDTPVTLAKAITMVIWNASIVHSFDHGALHEMMNDPTKPTPFVMRVPALDPTFPSVGDYLDSIGRDPVTHNVQNGVTGKDVVTSILNSLAIPSALVNQILKTNLTADTYPLCSAADVLYGKMADLLFYMPHNSTLLYETKYAFESDDVAKQFPDRTAAQLTQPQRDAITAAHGALTRSLDSLQMATFGPSHGKDPAGPLGFPYTRPPDTKPDWLSTWTTWTDADKKVFAARYCIAAGIQY